MKTFQAIIVVFFLLTLTSVSAQYGNNGYGNGYGNSGSGRNGGMNQMSQNREPEKPKEIPIEVTVGKIMEKIKPALDLDALQEIAIANVLTESIRSQGILLKDESNQEQKIKEFEALSETTDRKIKEFLNEDQKEKYKALNEENASSKKKRRNR
ncbi:hypothetical protein HNP99_002874 [Flavobacterium sp. 28A]|uniref:hypothetical protein n=1 Tax=Flavobacterium sp. 28A TaxID=2735895 RepID=UPI00156E1E91|nr:hypothetical protein [Flavobacterium sp. 28A]NRT16507.1 hypothetical protein [Flavobacterium sp. 28A]